jgi:hypothetical protein
MAVDCVSLARGKMLRITKLDECGAIVEGAGSSLVMKAFVSATITPNYQDPEEITQTDANGDICIDDRSPVALRWLDIELNLCLIDPTMINLITGDPLVVDDATPTPNTVGYRIDADLTGSANFALELWSGVSGSGACDESGFPKYGYWLFPWVKDAQWGEWVVENGALTLTLTARAVFGGGWGVGPYDIRRDATTPATLEPLLTAIGATQPMHYQTTTAPLPTPACGAVVLDITP